MARKGRAVQRPLLRSTPSPHPALAYVSRPGPRNQPPRSALVRLYDPKDGLVTSARQVSSLAEIVAPYEPRAVPEGDLAPEEQPSPAALFNTHADFVYRALRGFGLP